jgi:hypothetical protein
MVLQINTQYGILNNGKATLAESVATTSLMEAFSLLFWQVEGFIRVRPGADGILHSDHGYLSAVVEVSRGLLPYIGVTMLLAVLRRPRTRFLGVALELRMSQRVQGHRIE